MPATKPTSTRPTPRRARPPMAAASSNSPPTSFTCSPSTSCSGPSDGHAEYCELEAVLLPVESASLRVGLVRGRPSVRSPRYVMASQPLQNQEHHKCE